MDANHASKKRKNDDDAYGSGHSHVNKAPRTTSEQHVVFSMKSEVGCLKRALDVFESCQVDLKHIESRPDKQDPSLYAFFVTSSSPAAQVMKAVEVLKSKATKVRCFDENPDSSNDLWYPRTIRDLDKFATRILSCGEELSSDHPGFNDKTYLERRAYFAKIAIEYKHGTPIPRVEYTAEEVATWGKVFSELTKLYPTHACKEHNRVFPLLIENCGYRVDNIPQLEDISRFLHDCTGFRLRPVAGLLSSRDFLAGLAFRVFHSTQYIRHPTKPLYTPEPDVCHEILGHVPLFADKSFAEFSQEIGLASLGASDEDIKRLATLYWFTVEFGVCKQNGQLKAFGAGLLSSFGELEYCLSDKPKLLPFNPEVTSIQEYPITEYQPTYFVADSFHSAKDKLRAFAAKMKKPFTARYNPYTESIELLNKKEDLTSLALSVRNDVDMLVKGLQFTA